VNHRLTGSEKGVYPSYTPRESALGYNPVTNIFSGERDQMLYKITFVTGEVLTATAGHPFRTRVGWRDAQLLATGDELEIVSPDGSQAMDGCSVYFSRSESRCL
jgi:hypothetical protein